MFNQAIHLTMKNSSREGNCYSFGVAAVKTRFTFDTFRLQAYAMTCCHHTRTLESCRTFLASLPTADRR